ncbi:response regulator [bacterium]|nr:response regulator [bacterium]
MQPFKLLIVDDDPNVAESIISMLKGLPYTIISAFDGEQGLISAIKLRPDLIILDVEMPKMRGWEVCKLLKHSRNTQKIPILILTSHTAISDIMVAMQQGADDYMTKPFQKEELIKRIQRLLPNQQQSS